MRPLRRTALAAAAVATLVAAPGAGADQPSPSACPSAAAAPARANVDRVERTVLCLLNRERTSHGLTRLRGSRKLDRAAVRHSRDMVRRGFFAHDSPDGGTMSDRVRRTGWLSGARSYALAENIAWGTGSYATAQSIVAGWMDSPGHRRNILDDRYDTVGIGVALGAPGHEGGATYTTDFGTRG